MFDVPTYPVVAAAGRRVPVEHASTLRGESPVMLRHADEQTQIAYAAVRSAIGSIAAPEGFFANWGVVASARSFGRDRFATAIDRFRKLGAAGVIPLVVPHLSAHAMASSLSLVLGSHGPAFGVVGHQGHMGETLAMAILMIERESVDGVWAVVSEPDVASGQYHTAALAIGREAGIFELTLSPGHASDPSVGQLIDWLEFQSGATWRVGVPGVGAVEMNRREILKRAS